MFYHLPKKSYVCSTFLIIVKEMSNISDKLNMNQHEECLLRYLVNPLELFYTTELLKSSNEMIIQKMFTGEETLMESKKWKVESGKSF